jgi:hypothetical protein
MQLPFTQASILFVVYLLMGLIAVLHLVVWINAQRINGGESSS